MKVLAIKTILQGALVGIGNIIPGISGATIALILGIYERLLIAINNINLDTLKTFWRFITKKEKEQTFLAFLRRLDIIFLMYLGIGALIAIFSLSHLFTFLLQNHLAPTFGFFSGLILVSVVFPYQLLQRKSFKEVIAALLGIVFVVGLTVFMQPSKSEAHKEQKTSKESFEKNTSKQEKEKKYDFKKLGFYFIAGAIAISAMILPGISGSFILLLMGAYFEVLTAIKSFDIAVIAFFGAGCALGLLGFSRFLKYVFSKFYSPTLAFLSGLIIGSLYTLWPFQKPVSIGHKTLYGNHFIPETFGFNEVIVLATFVVGIIVVLAFYFYEKSHSATSDEQ